MDPARIIVRVVFAYIFVLVLTRLSGHRTINRIDVPSFVVALVIGDMFDDLFWSDVPASQFVVGVGTLFLVHLRLATQAFNSGRRNWGRAAR